MARRDRPAGGAEERIDEILAAVNGRWALTVMRHLRGGKSRPSDLLEAINAEARGRAEDRTAQGRTLSPKILREVLARLAALELVARTEVAGWPRETHYWLTDRGNAMLSDISALGSQSGRNFPLDTDQHPPAGIDPADPSPARIWDYYLHGKDNFPGDRKAAGASVAAMPSMPRLAATVRLFQADAITTLARLGVRQFLDIGAGLTADGTSVHEITRAAAPDSRIVYVDNDPAALAHARALFKGPEGAYDHVLADLRAPGTILAHASRTLDLSAPVAILLIGVLHFLQDDEDPWACVARLRAGVPGSLHIVMTHGASDIVPEEARGFEDGYNRTAQVKIRLRDRADAARFLDGMELLPPGVVPISQWPTSDPDDVVLSGYAGIGFQPGGPRQ